MCITHIPCIRNFCTVETNTLHKAWIRYIAYFSMSLMTLSSVARTFPIRAPTTVPEKKRNKSRFHFPFEIFWKLVNVFECFEKFLYAKC